MTTSPIGIFDSGVGGLTVLREIRQLLPYENLLYVADSGHAPYGDKRKEFIIERSQTIIDYFVSQQVKAVVVACNTATAAAVKELRPKYNLPIIAMEPAVKPAAELSKTGVIGVLATSRTIDTNNFRILFNRFAEQVTIIPKACPGLVEQIERGELNTTKTRSLIIEYVEPLLAQNADIIVLGCTHYPFLAPLIQDIVGLSVQVIDSGAAVARELRSRLDKANLLSIIDRPGKTYFFSSDHSGFGQQIIPQLWRECVMVSAFPEQVLV